MTKKFNIAVFYTCIILLGLPALAKSQQERYLDSLENLADHLSGEKRIDKLILICRRYNSLRMEKEFEKYCNQAENESRKINYKKGIAGCLHSRGLFYSRKSDFQNALKNYVQALRLRKEINDSAGIGGTLNNIGIICEFQGKLPQALEYYLGALHIREAMKDTGLISQTLNNVGTVYLNMGNNLKALEYYQKSNRLGELSRDGPGISNSLHNIGSVYSKMGEYTLAVKYFEKVIPYYEKRGDEMNKTGLYLDIGDNKRLQKNFKEAAKYFNMARLLMNKYGDKAGIALCYLNLGRMKRDEGEMNEAINMFKNCAEINKNIGDSLTLSSAQLELAAAYFATGNFAEAQITLNEVLKIAQLNKYQAEVRDAYQQLAQVKEKMSDYPGAYKYLQLYQTLNDSLSKESGTRQINELSAGFENEKKEKEIELLKKTQSLKELQVKSQQAEISKQKLYIVFSVVAILLVVLSLGLLANRYYLRKKSGDELFRAHSLLSEKNRQITDSITYAGRLQDAMLPREEEIRKFLPHSFIFFRPRDVVSGDFYWFSQVNNKSIAVVADCTGHGVPGSLVSMVGDTLLNQVVNEQKVEDPGEILTQLNKSFCRIFSGNTGERMSDGMDMSVCVVDPDFKTVSFAGARQSLFLVNEGKAEIIRGDRHSVGGVFSNTDSVYTSRKVQVKTATSIYMSSDGFLDQFRAGKKEKYMADRFCRTIERISTLDPDDQKEKLAAEFEQWKGPGKQMDDVLVWNIMV